MTRNHRIFIGSSTEHLHVAKAIQANLEGRAEVTVWDQGVFKLSATAIESLIDRVRETDAAIFVFGPDDVTFLRGQRKLTARDNIIFELGLYIGALGRQRCFLVVPSGTKNLRIPSDLAGVTYAVYSADRSDQNYRAALGPACDQIAEQLKKSYKESEHIIAYRSFQSQSIQWEELFRSTTDADFLFLGSPTWCHHHFARLQQLCSRNGARLRVLLPDFKDSAVLQEVGRRLNRSEDEVKSRMESAVNFFGDLAKGHPKATIEVWGIDQAPVFSLFRFGGRALIAFYSHRRRLVSVPTVLCSGHDETFTFAVSEFEESLQEARKAGRRLA